MTARSHFREITRDVVAYGIFSALTPIAGIILLPLLTRVLSVEEYGAVDLFASYVALLSVILRLALPSAVNRLYFEFETEDQRRQLVTTLTTFVALLGGLVTALAFVVLAPAAAALFDLPEPRTFITLGSVVASLNALVALPQAVLRLQRRILLYNVVSLLNTSCYLLFTVLLVVQMDHGVAGVFTAQALATGLAFVVGAFLVRGSLGGRPGLPLLRRALVFSFPMVPAVLVSWANDQADRLILVSLSGLTGVAIFGAAAKISGVFFFVVAIFRQAWQPYSMTLISAPERDWLYRTVLDCYMAGFVTLGLAFSALSPELCRLILPEEYWLGQALVPWMAGSALLHHSASITNLGILVSERTSRVLLASFAAVVINIGLSVPLIISFGVIGAALGAFVAQLGLATLLVHYSNQLSSIRLRLGTLLRSIGIYAVGAYFLLRCSDLPSYPVSLAARAGIVIVAGALAYRLVLDAPTRGSVRSLIRSKSARAT